MTRGEFRRRIIELGWEGGSDGSCLVYEGGPGLVGWGPPCVSSSAWRYGVAIQFRVFQFDRIVLFTPEVYWLVDQTRPMVAPVAATGSGLAPA